MQATSNATGLARWMPVRWQIAAALCLVTTINYIDRAALAIAAPFMMPELNMTNTQFGLVASGFFWAYALGQIFSGRAVDYIGTKRAFSIAVLVWNLASAAHALSRGFLSLLGFRVILGIGEAANFPAALKAISEWFPARERSWATGVLTMGPGFGNIIAPPLIMTLIFFFGWRWAFVVSGAIGIAWLLVWKHVYYSVEDHPRISDDERRMILDERAREATASAAQGHAKDAPRPSWLSFLRYREMWGLMLSRFTGDGAFYFFVTFLPLYLVSERGMNPAIEGVGGATSFDVTLVVAYVLGTMIPFLGADAGSFAGGWCGKKLMDRGMSLDAARKTMIWAGALLVLPVTLGALVVESTVMAVALITLALFAIQVNAANLFVLPADLFQSRDVATVWGIFGALGSIGGALFAMLAGWLIDNVSWAPVFIIVAIMRIVAAGFVQVFIPRVERLPPVAARA